MIYDTDDYDDVVHIDLIGRRKVYSAAAYDKLREERDRLIVWLRDISELDPNQLYSGYDAVQRATHALHEITLQDP